MSLLTTMKGLPLAYNKDMQEDKEMAFDAFDTVKGCIGLFSGMIAWMKGWRPVGWRNMPMIEEAMITKYQLHAF